MPQIGHIVEQMLSLSSYDVKDAVQSKANELAASEMSPYKEDGSIDSEFAGDVIATDAECIGNLIAAFETGKFMGDKDVKIKDVLMTKDYPKLFYAATEILMRDRIIPARVVVDNLFHTIPYSGSSLNVTIRTFGGVSIEEVPEGGQYPETSSAVSDQAYRMHLEIKKYGAKVSGTKELIESDNWGIFAWNLRQLAVELLNKKEALAIDMLNTRAGWVLMNNAAASSVPLGSCTGRGIDGNQNGTMTVDDIMNIMAWMQMRGYNVDTIVMHPFAWALWARDTEIREIILGGNVTYVPQGNGAPGWADPFNSLGIPYQRYGGTGAFSDPTTGMGAVDPVFGKIGVAPYSYPNLAPLGATYFTNPKHIDRPLKILVSPYVPYYNISGSTAGDTSGVVSPNGKYATNLIFADSNKCGLILQRENAVMEEWEDFEREINFVKIRERYGMTLQEQGRAIAVAKHVVIDRSYTFDNVNSVSLNPLMPTTNMV